MPHAIRFKCPMCSAELPAQQASLVCENNHTFDIARENYVNLLLAQHKRSRNPGDNADMVQSRQRFLNQGYYQTLAKTVASLINPDSQAILDMGCGEGYYLARIQEQLISIPAAGIDISKTAVKLAAKRKLGHAFAVASAFQLPFFNQSFSTAVSIFSPICPIETARILTPKGQLIMVGPGEQHLRGLVEHIYDTPQAHKGNEHALTDSTQLTLTATHEVHETLTIAHEHILDLLKMTPYYWHCQPEQQQALAALPELTTAIHFIIKVYTNNSSHET